MTDTDTDGTALPEEFITVPEPAAPMFKTFSGDEPMSLDDMLALMPEKRAEPRPDVALDALPQPAAVSDQTMEELDAGRRLVRSPIVSYDVPDVVATAQARQRSQLLEEQAAGRAAVLRKQGDIERGKQIMAAAAAHKLRTSAPASNDDLEYNTPNR